MAAAMVAPMAIADQPLLADLPDVEEILPGALDALDFQTWGPERERDAGSDPPALIFERRRFQQRRRRPYRHLRQTLAPRQRAQLAAMIALWAMLDGLGWSWWLQPRGWGSTLGVAVNSALLGVESVVLPIWFFYWIWRMRRPNPTLSVPSLLTAMVVTKAPSEPWAVVRETLEAMLAQDFPFPYDVWLADERPQPETLAWCEAHGVRVSSREGVADYQRPHWPRRTRCKEGNLAYFYDMWGYDLYDVVAQLDADHVPQPDYLRRMVSPFRDPDVGYVAAPSICDRNAQRSWSARARLYTEAILHGPTQAGHSGGCAPSCIGSHYAVRTAALQEIGGLGPELAEDFTTTLMMSSHGWHGVFAVDAIAHGDGPETLGDCMTQEFQWSRSMMNVLLGVNRTYWRGLTRAAKLRLGFCQVWYPLFAVLMLCSIAMPLVAIITRTPPMRVSLGGFYLHFLPPTLVLVLVVLWLRRLGMLRPAEAKVFSWEIVLFQLARWPWVLFGCAHAVTGRLLGREFDFKVTPKGRTDAVPLPARMIVPYMLIACVSAIPTVLGWDGGAANGYQKLALLNVGLYLGTAVLIPFLHIRDHAPQLRRLALRRSAPILAGVLAAAALLLAGIILPRALGHAEAAGPPPWPVPAVSEPVAVGVITSATADNSSFAWTPADLSQVNVFEHAVRRHASIVMWFSDWAHGEVDRGQLEAVARRGSVPEISWEPWNYLAGLRRPQSAYTLASIIDGAHDAYIRRWARSLRAYGGPVLLRFAQEMNGSWYPWSEGVNGNRPGQFVAAWRHVHDIFTAAHATNVRWVWSPVSRYGLALSTEQYPGDAYVDVIGLSGFNGGSALPWTGWRSFASLFDRSLRTIHRLAPDKPVQLSELGSVQSGGDEAAWIDGMFADLRQHPEVRSLVWFDLRKQADWRITSSRRAAAAFARGIAGLEVEALQRQSLSVLRTAAGLGRARACELGPPSSAPLCAEPPSP